MLSFNKKFIKILFISVLLFFVFTALFHELSHNHREQQECSACRIFHGSIPYSKAAAVLLAIVLFIKFLKPHILKLLINQSKHLARAPPSVKLTKAGF